MCSYSGLESHWENSKNDTTTEFAHRTQGYRFDPRFWQVVHIILILYLLDLVFPKDDTDSVLSPLQGCYDTESGYIFKSISPKVMVVIEQGNWAWWLQVGLKTVFISNTGRQRPITNCMMFRWHRTGRAALYRVSDTQHPMHADIRNECRCYQQECT